MGMRPPPPRLLDWRWDIIDLRAARWNSKDADKGPQTIVEIREAVSTLIRLGKLGVSIIMWMRTK
jgi:hypothetical protein